MLRDLIMDMKKRGDWVRVLLVLHFACSMLQIVPYQMNRRTQS